jgi:hypothetical protein
MSGTQYTLAAVLDELEFRGSDDGYSHDAAIFLRQLLSMAALAGVTCGKNNCNCPGARFVVAALKALPTA